MGEKLSKFIILLAVLSLILTVPVYAEIPTVKCQIDIVPEGYPEIQKPITTSRILVNVTINNIGVIHLPQSGVKVQIFPASL